MLEFNSEDLSSYFCFGGGETVYHPALALAEIDYHY